MNVVYKIRDKNSGRFLTKQWFREPTVKKLSPGAGSVYVSLRAATEMHACVAIPVPGPCTTPADDPEFDFELVTYQLIEI